MLKCILCAMGVLLSAAYAHAVSSSPTITYQGELIDGGTPVDDTCDFAFGLWDDPSAGTQVGFATIPAVDVVAGKFTVNVSFFPAGAFDGSPRWIEINVCCASPCDPSFTTLTPRQFLAAAPSSIRAIEGVGPPNALAVDESGRVGIGAAPNSGETAILQVTGGVRTTDFLQADGVITSGSTITVGGTSGVDGVMFPDGTLQITAATGGGTLDDAYDSRGAGAGRTIIADTGPVNIAGTDGLVVTGDIQGDRFVDGNNPAFFLDPASTLLSLNTAGFLRASAFSDADNLVYFLDPSNPDVSLAALGHIEGSKFLDSNNFSFFLDPASTTVSLNAAATSKPAVPSRAATSMWPARSTRRSAVEPATKPRGQAPRCRAVFSTVPMEITASPPGDGRRPIIMGALFGLTAQMLISHPLGSTNL